MRARGSGPCVVEETVSDVDFVTRTPDRQGQKRLCRVNVSKKFVERNPSEGATPVVRCGGQRGGSSPKFPSCSDEEGADAVSEDGRILSSILPYFSWMWWRP